MRVRTLGDVVARTKDMNDRARFGAGVPRPQWIVKTQR
jgi:hypothetical protein